MTTDTQTTEQPAQTTTTTTEPTLDEVYRDFKVEQPAQVATTETRQPERTQQAPPAVDLPDFYDPDKMKAWATSQASQQSALQSQFQQLSGAVSKAQVEAQRVLLERDISQAVETVNESVQLPAAQKKLIEYALEDKARSDPRFKQIWDHRHNQPIVWNRALAAVSREIADTFSVRADPQLAANRRALRESQASSATTQTGAEEAPAWQSAPADSAEFQKGWQRALNGGS